MALSTERPVWWGLRTGGQLHTTLLSLSPSCKKPKSASRLQPQTVSWRIKMFFASTQANLIGELMLICILLLTGGKPLRCQPVLQLFQFAWQHLASQNAPFTAPHLLLQCYEMCTSSVLQHRNSYPMGRAWQAGEWCKNLNTNSPPGKFPGTWLLSLPSSGRQQARSSSRGGVEFSGRQSILSLARTSLCKTTHWR